MLAVVFTDLDGTLLDHKTYGARAALPVLDLLRRRGHLVIPVSSKTSAETRRWVSLLSLSGPFIFENGCGIVLPKGFLSRKPALAVEKRGEWQIKLGIPIGDVQKALQEISLAADFRYKGFSKMSEKEVSSLTGLTGNELEFSMTREYDEPFVFQGKHDEALACAEAENRGFHLTRGGRFHHITGGCNKGKAVRILADLLKLEYEDPVMVGIGDSLNDLPMFRSVDRAYLVQKPDGSYDPDIPEDAAVRVRGIGPAGWRTAVEGVMTGG